MIPAIPLSTVIFFALALFAVAGAASVAFGRNIVYSGYSLLCTLAGVAGLYLFIGADFLGGIQLLVYVGGILVLLLFAVLLTTGIANVKLSNPSASPLLAAPLALGLTALLLHVVVRTRWASTEAVATPQVARMGDAFLREHLLLFELASVILLAALIGATSLARRATRPTQGSGEQAP
jgi:NADH-quinone oxidoreductase subunit J